MTLLLGQMNFQVFWQGKKTQAQNCMRDCERYLNDDRCSDSLKDGIRDLMSKSEENFGTLLHLERVMTMKNRGDFQNTTVHHTTSTAVADSRNKSPTSLPQTSKITGRFRQQKVKSMDFDHGSSGLFMSAPSNHEEIFDLGVEDEDLFQHHHRHVDSSDKRALTEDFDDDSGFKDVGAAYKNRQFHEKQTLMMAKSLPMNVPMPDNRRLFSNRSPPDIAEETQDIPTKIAELAKSLHMDAIGELPSPRLLEQ